MPGNQEFKGIWKNQSGDILRIHMLFFGWYFLRFRRKTNQQKRRFWFTARIQDGVITTEPKLEVIYVLSLSDKGMLEIESLPELGSDSIEQDENIFTGEARRFSRKT